MGVDILHFLRVVNGAEGGGVVGLRAVVLVRGSVGGGYACESAVPLEGVERSEGAVRRDGLVVYSESVPVRVWV